MVDVLSLLFVIVVAAVLIERLSLKIPYLFRPACQKTGVEIESDEYTIIEHAIVKRGRGRIVRMFQDEHGIQHVVLLWGPIARLPYHLLQMFFFQRTRKQPKYLGANEHNIMFESVSIFPVTHAHLLAFDEVFPGDWLDLRGARVVEMYSGNKPIMFGAKDLNTWRHKKCPFLLPA